MIDLDAIRARCDAVDELKRAYPYGWWAKFISDPTAAPEDRKELLDEVERLQARHTSIKQSYDLEVESRIRAKLEVERLRRELAWEAMCARKP